MNIIDFNAVVDTRIADIQDTLMRKRNEYADNDEVLHNFIRAANTLGCTKERALIGMAVKHWVSILDIVDKTDEGEFTCITQIHEKIGDMINYLIILEAMYVEEEFDNLPF